MASSAPRPASWSSKEAGRPDLWQHVFGDVTGTLGADGNPTPVYLAVWSGRRIPGQQALDDVKTSYFEWPKHYFDASQQLAHESENGREAYFCAHLLTKKRRVKENASLMLAAYVDGDGAQPGPSLPAPTAIIESSAGRQQFYWRFTVPIDPNRAEQINKRLAYAMGADKSGWDLTQVLRAPGCRNWKYTPAPRVEIVSIKDRAYDPDELERILPDLPAEAAPRVQVKLERSAAAAPIGDRDQRARERMYAAKRGNEIQMLANGGSVKSKPEGGADVSGDDLSYASALAFWFDKDPARMAAEMWRSNRVRNKWSEVHSSDGSTYLEMTIGKAIASCSQSFRDLTGHDAGDSPVSIGHIQVAPPAPHDEAAHDTECPCEGDHTKCTEIQELRQSNRDLIAWVERLAAPSTISWKRMAPSASS